MERESKPCLHWEMLQEAQGLDSLFSGPSSHMFELQAQSAWVKKAKWCCPLVLPQWVQLVSKATAHSYNNRSSQPSTC